MAAAVLFVLSVGINLSTWVFPGIARYFGPLMCTHMAVLAVAFVYSYSCQETEGSKLQRIEAPVWVRRFSTVMAVYIFLMFAFLFANSRHGGPNDGNGLEIPEDLPLEKTTGWHSFGELMGLRLFSSFWMFFSFQIAADAICRNFTTRFGRYDAVVKRI